MHARILKIGLGCAVLLIGCQDKTTFQDRSVPQSALADDGDHKGNGSGAESQASPSGSSDKSAIEVVVEKNKVESAVVASPSPLASSNPDVLVVKDEKKDSAIPSPSPSPAKEDEEVDDVALNDKEIGDCAMHHGVQHADVIKIQNDFGSKISVPENKVLALKLTSHDQVVNVSLASAESNSEIKGVCVFIAGGRNQLKLKLQQISVKKLLYVGRGKNSELVLNVGEGAKIDDIKADVGNNSSGYRFGE